MLTEITVKVDIETEAHGPLERSVTDWLNVTRQIRDGDTESLRHYYEEYFEVMFSEARHIAGRDEATSLDIVQDAMLKAVRCMKALPDADSVAAWTRAVAKSVAYDWLRKEARQNQLLERVNRRPSNATEDKDSVPEDFARLQWLEQQLLELPPDQQQLISFRYRLGWSLRKIAKRLGLKTGAVDGRIRRAIEKLKEKAEREYNDE